MNSPFMPKLPKCHSILSYEAVEEIPIGILSYPGSGLSWDIDSSVAYEATPVTFKIRATSSKGKTYESNKITITISQDSDFSPTLDASTSNIESSNEVFMIG